MDDPYRHRFHYSGNLYPYYPYHYPPSLQRQGYGNYPPPYPQGYPAGVPSHPPSEPREDRRYTPYPAPFRNYLEEEMLKNRDDDKRYPYDDYYSSQEYGDYSRRKNSDEYYQASRLSRSPKAKKKQKSPKKRSRSPSPVMNENDDNRPYKKHRTEKNNKSDSSTNRKTQSMSMRQEIKQNNPSQTKDLNEEKDTKKDINAKITPKNYLEKSQTAADTHEIVSNKPKQVQLSDDDVLAIMLQIARNKPGNYKAEIFDKFRGTYSYFCTLLSKLGDNERSRINLDAIILYPLLDTNYELGKKLFLKLEQDNSLSDWVFSKSVLIPYLVVATQDQRDIDFVVRLLKMGCNNIESLENLYQRAIDSLLNVLNKHNKDEIFGCLNKILNTISENRINSPDFFKALMENSINAMKRKAQYDLSLEQVYSLFIKKIYDHVVQINMNNVSILHAMVHFSKDIDDLKYLVKIYNDSYLHFFEKTNINLIINSTLNYFEACYKLNILDEHVKKVFAKIVNNDCIDINNKKFCAMKYFGICKLKGNIAMEELKKGYSLLGNIKALDKEIVCRYLSAIYRFDSENLTIKFEAALTAYIDCNFQSYSVDPFEYAIDKMLEIASLDGLVNVWNMVTKKNIAAITLKHTKKTLDLIRYNGKDQIYLKNINEILDYGLKYYPDTIFFKNLKIKYQPPVSENTKNLQTVSIVSKIEIPMPLSEVIQDRVENKGKVEIDILNSSDNLKKLTPPTSFHSKLKLKLKLQTKPVVNPTNGNNSINAMIAVIDEPREEISSSTGLVKLTPPSSHPKLKLKLPTKPVNNPTNTNTNNSVNTMTPGTDKLNEAVSPLNTNSVSSLHDEDSTEFNDDSASDIYGSADLEPLDGSSASEDDTKDMDYTEPNKNKFKPKNMKTANKRKKRDNQPNKSKPKKKPTEHPVSNVQLISNLISRKKSFNEKVFIDRVDAYIKAGNKINDAHRIAEGKSPITFAMMAANSENLDALGLLMCRYQANLTTLYRGCGSTPFITVCKNNDEASIRYILNVIKDAEMNADINLCPMFSINNADNRGRTPLFYAIINKNWDICKLLIENGANAKFSSKDIKKIKIPAEIQVLLNSSMDVKELANDDPYSGESSQLTNSVDSNVPYNENLPNSFDSLDYSSGSTPGTNEQYTPVLPLPVSNEIQNIVGDSVKNPPNTTLYAPVRPNSDPDKNYWVASQPKSNWEYQNFETKEFETNAGSSIGPGVETANDLSNGYSNNNTNNANYTNEPTEDNRDMINNEELFDDLFLPAEDYSFNF